MFVDLNGTLGSKQVFSCLLRLYRHFLKESMEAKCWDYVIEYSIHILKKSANIAFVRTFNECHGVAKTDHANLILFLQGKTGHRFWFTFHALPKRCRWRAQLRGSLDAFLWW